MRKINSIGYGHKIIGTASSFLVVIPVCSHLVSTFTSKAAFLLLSRISMLLGAFILLLLFGLLKIELFQDKKMNKYFESNKKTILALQNGLYECQSCGNRQVKLEHKNCYYCGVYFKNREEYYANNK